MAEENLKLRTKIAELKKKLDESESLVSKMKKQNEKLTTENIELIRQIEELKVENSQQKVARQLAPDNRNSQKLKRTAADALNVKTMIADDKRQKLSAKDVPNWLIEVLAWIKRTEMADSRLSTSCLTFKRLCWPRLHGNVRPFFAEPIGFYFEEDEFGSNSRAVLHRYGKLERTLKNWEPGEIIPIAAVPSPNYILGFQEIHLWHLDDQILQFLANAIKKDEEIILNHCVQFWNWKATQIIGMHKLLTEFPIFQLDFNQVTSLCYFEEFNRLFPEIVEQIQALRLFAYDKSLVDFIFNWLTKKRCRDGKYKIHWVGGRNPLRFIERIKEEFAASTEPNPFFLIVYYARRVNMNLVDFRMENEQTGEVLKLFRKERGNRWSDSYLIRYNLEEAEEELVEKIENQISRRKTEIFVRIENEESSASGSSYSSYY